MIAVKGTYVKSLNSTIGEARSTAIAPPQVDHLLPITGEINMQGL